MGDGEGIKLSLGVWVVKCTFLLIPQLLIPILPSTVFNARRVQGSNSPLESRCNPKPTHSLYVSRIPDSSAFTCTSDCSRLLEEVSTNHFSSPSHHASKHNILRNLDPQAQAHQDRLRRIMRLLRLRRELLVCRHVGRYL